MSHLCFHSYNNIFVLRKMAIISRSSIVYVACHYCLIVLSIAKLQSQIVKTNKISHIRTSFFKIQTTDFQHVAKIKVHLAIIRQLFCYNPAICYI